MVKLSQSERDEERPPFEIVDGRDDRTRNIDSEIGVWHQKHPAPEIKRPSELKRGDGLQLVKKFGIMVCTRRSGVRSRSKRFQAKSCTRPCGYLIVVENGEKLPRCNGCGQRVWVKCRDVIFQHDDLEVVKMVVGSIKGWQGRGKTMNSLLFLAKLNEWARRAEERIGERNGVKQFFAHMPWNLPKVQGNYTHGV